MRTKYPGVVSLAVSTNLEDIHFGQRLTEYEIDVTLINKKRIRATIPSVLVDPPRGNDLQSTLEWVDGLVFNGWDRRVAYGPYGDVEREVTISVQPVENRRMALSTNADQIIESSLPSVGPEDLVMSDKLLGE